MTRDAYTEDSKLILNFLYQYWAEERRPPDVRDVVLATGLDFRSVRRSYRQLQDGFALVADEDRLSLGLRKVTPFSATPTPVCFHLGGHFHSYLGCPAEALTVGCLPMFRDKVLDVRASCSCCYQPIRLEIRGGEILSTDPLDPLILFVASPFEWEEGVPADRVCDSIRFVLDSEHARRYERQIGRRGVIMTMVQLASLSAPVGRSRMWDPHWPPLRVSGHEMVDALDQLGVDVSEWRLD